MTTSGGAYFLWDFGIKHGNFKLLSNLSYGNPIISVLLLAAFHQAQLTINLLFACLFVVAGAVVGSVNWKINFQGLRKIFKGVSYNQSLSSSLGK